DFKKIELKGYFDLIILNQVIEHFPNPDELLMTCRMLLKPEGRIFIETPSIDGLDFKVFKNGAWGGYHIPRHFYIFNEKTISKLLVQCGYSVEAIEYLASPAFWTQSLHH